MQKRKAHNKSRRGCQNCKKRHVKCDEQGPPCAACVIRKTTNSCVYQSSPDSATSHENIVLPERHLKNGSTKAAESKLNIVASFSPPPTAFSSLRSHRLLELELMHRWTTRTWSAFYSIPGDQEFLQFDVPRAALENSYLMNGMLAITAVDLARSSKGSSKTKYICAALDYSNKACADFRPQLFDINKDNIHLLYLFGMIAAGFEFALPFEPMSAINRMSNGFDLMLGAFDITLTNPGWFFESYSSLQVLLSYDVAPMDLVDDGARVALEYLTSVSRQIRVPASVLEARDKKEHEDPLASELPVYQIAVAHMKYCFAEDARALIKGYCLSLVSAAGRDFALAFKRLEPMALFIILYFGVLLDRVAQDPLAWWITSTGRDLVKEASEILLQSPIAQITEGRLGIYWTRQQVGLPMLVDVVALNQVIELH